MTTLPTEITDSLAFERANWAKGSVLDDPFYAACHGSSKSPPGTVLRLEKHVDPAQYSLPPTTALSRLVYQSETSNGSKVPVSAYVLWPYSPRSGIDGHPVVAWAHGTSGVAENAAPSHHKNLGQHFLAPYQLALQGYVVIGTDYAGLGVGRYPSGKPIVHEYLTSASQAKDVVYSVRAAQAAYSELSQTFVVMGHSQGGGAAWAVAQLAAKIPIPGYLGAIAVSPYTNILKETTDITSIIAAAMCPGIASACPEFKPGDVLTIEGQKRLQTVHETGAEVSSAMSLLSGVDLLKPDWRENPHVQGYVMSSSAGRKLIKGPLLIIHGTSDPILSVTVVDAAVTETAELFPSSQIEYIRLPDITHVSALPASQRVWMDWIGALFAGEGMRPGCNSHELSRAHPKHPRRNGLNWYLEPATKAYHAFAP